MNNCELCIGQSFSKSKSGEGVSPRLEDVLDWKTSSVFDDAERAALEVAEAITALKGRYNSVPDVLWSEIENHYDEQQRAALVLFI